MPLLCQRALRDLSAWLARHYGSPAIILIDEYDTPIQAGFTQGFYDQAVRFFRNFLSGGLKDNPHLFKGVLTGVLRIARESLFSGVNNLDVYSFLARQFGTAFGFTEEEVRRIAAADGNPELLEGLRTWYNGYLFGGEVIYNPWSVLNFINRGDLEFRPYWTSTSSDDLLREPGGGRGGQPFPSSSIPSFFIRR